MKIEIDDPVVAEVLRVVITKLKTNEERLSVLSAALTLATVYMRRFEDEGPIRLTLKA